MTCTHVRTYKTNGDSSAECLRCQWDVEKSLTEENSKKRESDGIITKLAQLILCCFPVQDEVYRWLQDNPDLPG